MLMEIALPKMGELLVMMTIVSSPGGIAPSKGKSAPAQVSTRDGDALFRKCSPDFF